MAISAGKGNRLVKRMIQLGYVLVHEINLGGRGGSVKYLELTDKGYAAIGVEPRKNIGRGAGFEHCFWQYRISDQLKNIPEIKRVAIEGILMNKSIDVLIETERGEIAIEIAMTAEHEKTNIEKDLEAGCSRVIIGCKDKIVYETMLKIVIDLAEGTRTKVTICLVQKVVDEFERYLQTPGGNRE